MWKHDFIFWILFQDKHKEKKHRKEKREKEKREGAEKKEKDRGDGKHREKKDRKDKHRDKTKDREKEKKKEKEKHEDKKSASGEKRVADQLKGYKGQNVGKIPDSNKLKSLTEEKLEGRKDSKVAPEVGGKIHNENRIGNQSAEKWENGGAVRLVTNSVGSWAEGMDKTNEKRESDRQLHRPGLDYKGTPVQRNPVVRNVPRPIQNSLEELQRTKENIENRVEGKEMAKEKGGDGHKGDRKKEKDREKKSQEKGQNKDKEKSRDNDKKKSGGKDEDKDNEKRKSKIVNQTDESRSIENDRVKNSNQKILSYAEDVYPSHLPKDGGSSSAERKIAKQEEVEANGILLHGECYFIFI